MWHKVRQDICNLAENVSNVEENNADKIIKFIDNLFTYSGLFFLNARIFLR